jgi:hypothetical protein
MGNNNDVTKMPVIGTLRTKVINMVKTIGDKSEPYAIPAETYNVVEIFNHNGKEFYVTSLWYKEYKKVPLIIVEDIIEEYIPTDVGEV